MAICTTPTCTNLATRSRCFRCRHQLSRYGDPIAVPPDFIRLPMAPLIDIVDPEHRHPRTIADLLGVHRSQIRRWMATGIDADYADRLAIRLGRHPVTIWGDAFWSGTVIDGTVDPGIDLIGTAPDEIYDRPRIRQAAA